MTGVVVAGVPRDRLLPVTGERMSGDFAKFWQRLWIECGNGPIATTQLVDHVSVDKARIMAVDVEALADWDDKNAQDGKEDAVFWGHDALAVAAQTGAKQVEAPEDPTVFGLVDLPVDEADDKATQILALQADTCRIAPIFALRTLALTSESLSADFSSPGGFRLTLGLHADRYDR